jgi:hypothetical protein
VQATPVLGTNTNRSLNPIGDPQPYSSGIRSLGISDPQSDPVGSNYYPNCESNTDVNRDFYACTCANSYPANSDSGTITDRHPHSAAAYTLQHATAHIHPCLRIRPVR